MPAGNIELEGVHQLVAEHAIGLRHRRRERHDDAPPHRLGDAANRIGHDAGHHVRLGEFGLASVDHQRLPLRELMVEHRRDPRVPALGELRRDARRAGFALVIKDVEVRGRQDAKVEVLVLDFVATEVLRERRGRDRRNCQQE